MRPAIDQTVIFTYTNDLPAASNFFRNVMELEFVADQGACHIFRLNEKSFIGVCDLPHTARDHTGVMITLVSDDVDGWHKFLTAKGVEYTTGPVHKPQFGIYTSVFTTPDGYRIEIQSFDDPAWHTRTL